MAEGERDETRGSGADDDPARGGRRDGAGPLPGTSSPDERARLVAEALAHVEARDQAYRRPLPVRARWKGVVATALVAVAALVAAAPPAWVAGPPPAAVSPEARVRGARLALYLQSRAIESFRAEQRRLPESLDEVGGGLPGVRYVRSSDRVYQLVARDPAGRAIVLDSVRPDSAFERAARGLEAFAGTR